MRTRPDHINYDPPRGSNIADFRLTLGDSVTPITDEERDTVCQMLDDRGLFGADLPVMLGLVQR